MDKIIGITNAPDDVISAFLSETPIAVLAHGKYVGGHVVIYEDSQQIASGDLINGQDVEGTGTYAYNLTPIEGYSGYDNAKSYRLVIGGDEIDSVKNGILTNLPLDAMYIIADFGSGMQVVQTYPNLSSVSVSQTKTVTTKKYQTKKLDKSLLPDGVESGIETANTKAATALSAAQAAQNTANEAISDANAAQSTANAAQTTASTAKSTADAALPKTGGELSGKISVTDGTNTATLGSSVFHMKNVPPGETQVADNVHIDYDQFYLGPNQSSTPGIALIRNEGSSTPAYLWLSHRTGTVQIKSNGEIYSSKKLVLSCQNELEIQRVGPTPTATSLVLHSSTLGSNKRFRITVDDTGKISATEVTDA